MKTKSRLTKRQKDLLQYVMDWIASPKTSQQERQQLATDWLNQNCPHWQQSMGGKRNAN